MVINKRQNNFKMAHVSYKSTLKTSKSRVKYKNSLAHNPNQPSRLKNKKLMKT